MSREWRRECPRVVRGRQEAALAARELFLLRQAGPTAYVIKETNKKDPVKVCLGERHTCSCREFTQNGELCLHICWVLLRKLKLKAIDPLSYQTGLQSRELFQVMYPRTGEEAGRKRQPAARKPEGGAVPKRTVAPGDCCPICLDDFGTRQAPVVHCRHGCGRAVHVRCMEVLGAHQEGASLTCPLCRGTFCSRVELGAAPRAAPGPRQLPPPPRSAAIHPWVDCRLCRAGPPLPGPIYKCLQCPQVIICSTCLNSTNFKKMHYGHRLGIKRKPEDHWGPLKSAEGEPARVCSPLGGQRLGSDLRLPPIGKPNFEKKKAGKSGKQSSNVPDSLPGLTIRGATSTIL